MYEERLMLQQKNNNLKRENMKLQTKLKNIMKEATKFENLFVQVSVPTHKNKKSSHKTLENPLTVKLRKQIKEIKAELTKSKKKVESYKRKVKYTNIEELESEVKAFETEAIRLRHLLSQTVKQKVDQAS
jgi:hypothetical protein